jgi:spore germination protein YaaH
MKKNVIILFLSISIQIIAQNNSIHETEKSLYSNQSALTELNKSSSILGENKVVFGYLPWWIYADSSYKSVISHRELLTHIAVFSFQADSVGKLIDPPLWPWQDILAFTKMMSPNAPQIIMTVTNSDGNTIHKFLNDETIRINLIDSIKSKLTTWGMNGVNIDFESLLDEDKGYAINNFMSQLNSSVKSVQPFAEVSIAVPPVSEGKWDFNGLSESCDYLMVMCYDYYGSWSSTTGPSAPFSGSSTNSYHNVQRSFSEDFSDIVKSKPEKLILGVPYYGNYWKTNSPNPYDSVIAFDTTNKKNNWQKSLHYKEIVSQYESKDILWDDVSKTPWIKWQSDSTWNQIWFDNDSSLALKYDYALNNNLRGIGIWALGFDDGREELWNMIKKKFIVTSANQEFPSLPSSFRLYQNYPNPFNPETIIQFSIPGVGAQPAVYVQLKIYDSLGREVATLVDEEKIAGNYKITFNAEKLHELSLPSGVYFYRLSAGGFVQTKKMILLR